MSNKTKSFLILLLVVCLQAIFYKIIFEPYIITWGATEEEAEMSLSGDELAPDISSTRSITIDASTPDVWNWIIQLGADRGGFFSYEFIENSLGYDGNIINKISPDVQDMKVGRIIPGSLNQEKTFIEYSWLVLAVEQGESFVLENWGAFVVKKINEQQTRLIVRTHGREIDSLGSMINSSIMLPLHFFMERRMLMGFKARAEGYQLSTTTDILWFLFIILSYAGIIPLIFLSRGYKTILLPLLLSLFWLSSLLIFQPHPLSGFILFVAELIITAGVVKKRKKAKVVTEAT